MLQTIIWKHHDPELAFECITKPKMTPRKSREIILAKMKGEKKNHPKVDHTAWSRITTYSKGKEKKEEEEGKKKKARYK